MNKKTALITGGGTGLGLAIARQLSDAGWDCVCLGLDFDDPWPRHIQYRKVDVTDDAAIVEIMQEFAAIGALVNCAGIVLHDGQELTAAGFDRVVDVNLNAVNFVTLAALKGLESCNGSVVNIASMWSYFGSARNPGYAASKAAIVSLTRSHAVAFAPKGIRVNAVAPGWIETRMGSAATRDPIRAPAILSRIPKGRFGAASDVANVVEFLLSEKSEYIVGTTINVDGGYSIS